MNNNNNMKRVDPIAIPKPSPTEEQQQQPVHRQHIQDRYYAGNVQLMEARVMELSTTIRALYRSVQELFVAIDEECNSDSRNCNSNYPDPDFVDAIVENTCLIERHQKELHELITSMNDLGATSAEIPDDIKVIDVASIKQQLKQYLAASQQHKQQQQQHLHDTDNDGSGGIYL